MKNTLTKIIIDHGGKELSASSHGRLLSEEIFSFLQKHNILNEDTFIEKFMAALRNGAAGLDVSDFENAYKVSDLIIQVLKDNNIKNLNEIFN